MRLLTITDNLNDRTITVDQLTGSSGKALFVVEENGEFVDHSTVAVDAREVALKTAARRGD